MKKGAFKQRMVGAIFILSLGVIFIPVILDTPAEEVQFQVTSKPQAPALPEVSEVAKINYVFSDLEGEPQVAPEAVVAQAPAVETPSKPVPVPEVKKAEPVKPPVAAVAKVEPKIHGEWTVQLGAFSSSENANELMHRLTKQGFDSYLKINPNTHMVRVYVAPGVDKDKAQVLKSKLDSQLGIKGILVKYQEQ